MHFLLPYHGWFIVNSVRCGWWSTVIQRGAPSGMTWHTGLCEFLWKELGETLGADLWIQIKSRNTFPAVPNSTVIGGHNQKCEYSTFLCPLWCTPCEISPALAGTDNPAHCWEWRRWEFLSNPSCQSERLLALFRFSAGQKKSLEHRKFPWCVKGNAVSFITQMKASLCLKEWWN